MIIYSLGEKLTEKYTDEDNQAKQLRIDKALDK